MLAWATYLPRALRTPRQQLLSRVICTATIRPPSLAAATRNADPSAVAVVVGASRGIGLAIVQTLVKRWRGRIVATTRKPDDAGALGALWQFMPDRLSIVPLDVCDESSVSFCTLC